MVEDAGSFWDARAREDAYYFVDSRQRYGDADAAEFWGGGERGLDALLDALGLELEGGETVVEIGCGIGRITHPLAGRCARVLAIDVSSEMLRLAREHGAGLDNVEWLLGDGTSLEPVADRSADACVSTVVFQHIPDPRVTLGYVREVGRVLRPGGWAALNVSNDPDLHRRSRRERLRSRVDALLRRGPRGREHRAWVGSAVDLGDLERVAGEAGMTLERVVGAGTQYCAVLLRRS